VEIVLVASVNTVHICIGLNMSSGIKEKGMERQRKRKKVGERKTRQGKAGRTGDMTNKTTQHILRVCPLLGGHAMKNRGSAWLGPICVDKASIVQVLALALGQGFWKGPSENWVYQWTQ
jgi:hypothetical protein